MLDRHGRKNTIKCGETKKNNTTEQKLHTSGATRRRFPPYLVGRLTTMKTQRNSFTGREGFAIAAEAKFDGAIITIFSSSSVPMDASVYSLGSPSPRCITHASGSGSANLDPTQTYGGAGWAKNGMDAGKSAPSQRSRRFSRDRQLTRP